MSDSLKKARAVRSKNIAKTRKELSSIVKKIDKTRKKTGITATEACRKHKISTERYYRFKRK